ncbi:MAG: glycine cleavage system protein GcvH [Cohaesibacteraceae bacterium]|nr:glycine cleavage system protein GcvH [Cohaesibacteraceae bacterium]
MSTYYSEDHEWITVEGDTATVGITDFAQSQLGDVVFVELPDTGKDVAKGDEAAVVESVKAASEIYAPLSGSIVAINDVLADEPGKVNEDAEGIAWFFKIKMTDTSELDGMMDAAAYKAHVDSQ